MWWKVYIVFVLALQFHSYRQLFAIEPISDNYAGLAFSIIEIFGLMGFIAQRRLVAATFWKIFLWACLCWDIYGSLTAFDWYRGWNPKIFIMIPALLSPLIFYLPLYRALYLYGYRSTGIWERSDRNIR
jgi:hypothetical protein